MTKTNLIVRFDQPSEQVVGGIKKIVGLLRAKYMVPIIDNLNLEANPRSSKTGNITNAIQETIVKNPALFPFKSKGILLASSEYELLDRNRYKLIIVDRKIEGILDGGHNTLAIGLYILDKALKSKGKTLNTKSKTWSDFKALWNENRNIVDDYLKDIRQEGNPSTADLDFLIPVELDLPNNKDDYACVQSFRNDLIDICFARNNNAELQASAKSNQRGYFDTIKELLKREDKKLFDRIEWKTNEGGDVKVQDIIALAWIPLALVELTSEEEGSRVNAPAPNNLYSSKGICLTQFEKFMSSSEVTLQQSSDYRRELKNPEVESALEIAVQLPALYDYIYENFKEAYNKAGGSYGSITAVHGLNFSKNKTTGEEKKLKKSLPFSGKKIADDNYASPEGFIVPMVYGLTALLERKKINGYWKIVWKQDPKKFLEQYMNDIMSNYKVLISLCDYDPQKIGKTGNIYKQMIKFYQMSMKGI